MSEFELQATGEEEEDSGLSTGAQLGVAAFFLGLPVIGMGVEMLGWGEIGLVAAGLTAGSLGLGTKFLIDRKRSEEEPGDIQPGNRFAEALMQVSGLDRLQYADWGALLRPVGAPAPMLAAPKEADEEIITAPLTEEDSLFAVDASTDTGGIDRLTIEQIVANCEPNSYKIFIGRSLTKPGNKAVRINFYKQHFRFIGASQRGKSSMVAAFMEIVTRTHDPKHVRLVLLDKEDQTSNLFAHLPHVLSMKKSDGSTVKLHARNEDQVLEYLIHCVNIMNHRYTMPKSQILSLPIILVYIEEFLAVKNEFKARIDRTIDKDAKDKAISDYATFMHCIGLLAQLGLKNRVQLLLCAQVEYADDDFREAMASIGCGFSFCVRPKAAASAGFMNNELLNRNAKDNKVGQAVVETPDCNDLVLAPDYDLEKRILEFETNHPGIHPIHQTEDDTPSQAQNSPVNVNAVNTVNEPVKPVNNMVNVGERSVASGENSPAFTIAQEVQVILAFEELKASGEKVSRTNLRDWLGWNNKQWQTLKAICDKNKILMD